MQTIHLDVSNKGVVPAIYAKQGDVGRKFRAVITDNGEAYDIPADALLSVWYSGTSGEGNYSMIGENSAFSIDGNTVTVELITQMLANHGSGNVCLVMNRQDGTQIGTWNIPYIVEQLPGMGSSAAEQYFTALSEVAGKAAESAAKATEAAATFETDESLSVAGKAADAAATGEALAGKAPVALGAPHNYLDNSDFRNPVNQRGLTSLTTSSAAVYMIDRWFIGGASATANNVTNIISDGVEIVGSCPTYGNNFRQYIPIDATNKTMTLAVCDTNGNIIIVSGKPVVGSWIKTDTAWGYIGLQQFEGKLMANIRVTAGNTHAFRWAALYEGEYTAETLPEYKPKGYAAELDECRRYYRRYENISFPCSNNPDGNIISGYIPGADMRVNPTAIITNSAHFFYGSGNYSAITDITAVNSSNGVLLTCTTESTLPANLNGIANMSSLELRAEL